MATGDGSSFRLVQQANAICGEGPIWDWRENLLYWIDLERPAAYAFDPRIGQQVGNWPLGSRVGMAALSKGGNLVVATSEDGIGYLELSTGLVTPLVHPAGQSGPGSYNDGRADRAGRLWVGWIAQDRTNAGTIHRIATDGTSEPAIDEVYASNGLAWSPDNRTMYFTDSQSGTVWAAEFDFVLGTLGRRREFFHIPRQRGIPDGLTVDAEGCIWIALYLGWHILRLDPNGRVLLELRTPVLNPTSLTFGGEHLDVLYVTSAVRRHQASELSGQPWAGALMAINPGVAGLPEAVSG